MGEISIDSCLLKFKVTCVKCVGNFLYAGVGGNLLIFEAENQSYKLREQIKNVLPNNIYGILPDKESKNIAIYGNKKLTVIPCFPCKWTRTEIWEAKQWILCIQWLDGESLAVVTGLNEVDLLNWTTKSVIKTAVCEEKCIIYSAHLIGYDWDNLIFLLIFILRYYLFTIFYEIPISIPYEFFRFLIKFSLQGVIFSVTYNHVTRTICSTSDDRTVRIWNVLHPEQCDRLNLEQWIHSSIEGHVSIFGHTARVWRGAMLDNGKVVSIGEDSLLCIWDEDGKNLLKQETHQGGRLCCLDIDKQRGIAITGGADGGINQWCLNSGLNDVIKTDLPDQEPARLLVLASGSIVVVYRTGRLVECHKSCPVFQDTRFVNYCLSETSICGRYVALGSIQGDILILEDRIGTDGTLSLVAERKIFKGKVFSIQWLDSNRILCCGSEGDMAVCELDQIGEELSLKPREHFILPHCRERWVTCAVLHYPFLICGTRNGSIHVYQMGPDNLQDPVQSIHKIHGRLGVTSLITNGNSLWSTGRDGSMRRFLMDERSNKIDQISVDRLPFAWVAKIIQTEIAGTLVVGFHEKDVVVWSQRSRVIIWSLNCCGGHREWKCFVNNNLLHFYFIKDKTIHLIKKPLEQIAAPPLLEGFHTREINTLKMLQLSDSISLLVSGGEDNTLRISFLKSGRSLDSKVVLTGHLSSVRTLAVMPTQEKSRILLFSAGGRAQIKAWELQYDISNEDEPVVLKSVELASHMINDEIELRKNQKNTLPRLDPETRYMDISVRENIGKEGHYSVYTACSDGYLRVFDFSLQQTQFTLSTSISLQRCLLKTGILDFENKLLILMTTTNGLVCVWDSVNNEQIINHRVFESGVNSCDKFKMAEGEYLIASGGDNCKVAVDLIDLKHLKVVGLWKSSHLHFSQVSGVKLEDDLLFTVGVDQRLNILKWSMTNNDFQIVHLHQYCSYVPDVHGLSIIRRKDVYTVCIFGVGIEVLEVSPNSLTERQILS
ncbi:WD repeat-containing protein 6 [Nilaparvata lugens]|uniref:WD repeat-containing protein 6 n=1 Tax=Nilaparvata lugens TaxID=108931 RepID=UPI00193D42E0|nr:WD repeat-containing protein 6 [Nilaparvata lugens]